MKRYTKYFFLCLYFCIFPPICAMENKYGYEILSKVYGALSTTFVCGTECILFSFLYLYKKVNEYNYRHPNQSQHAQNPDKPDDRKNTPLGNAIKKYPYNLTYIENLLKLGANPNIESGFCKTRPIMLAIDQYPKINPIELIKLFIKYNAEINYFDALGHTPLSRATQRDNFEVVSYLLECKADPNDSKIYYKLKPPLIYASKNGNLGIVKLLLNKKANVNINCIENPSNSVPVHAASKITPLSAAIKYKRDEITKYLLENDADPNNPSEGDKPLELASKNGNLEIVTLLLEKKADINARNGAPLCAAAKENNLEMVQYLLKFKNPDQKLGNALVTAVSDENFDMVKLLVKNNADVNDSGIYNFNALYETIARGNLEITKYLLENDANPNMFSSECKKTPLNFAIEKNNFDIVKLLVQHKADVNQSHPLRLALITNNSLETVQLLCNAGACLNTPLGTIFNLLPSHCNTKNLTRYCTTIMTHAHFDQELTTTRGIEFLVTLQRPIITPPGSKNRQPIPKEMRLALLKALYIKENYDNLVASTPHNQTFDSFVDQKFTDFVKELYKELDVITYRNPIFTQVYKHITQLKKILQIKTKTNETALDELQDYGFHLEHTEQIKQLLNGTKLDNDFEKLKKALIDISNSNPTKTPAELIAPLSAKLDPDNLAFQIYKKYALFKKIKMAQIK